MVIIICSSILSLLFAILMGFSCSAHARIFYVGGDDGWTLEPSVDYFYWAEKYRFQINDEIVFRYKRGRDSVLVVSENDYSKCNKDNPIKTLKSGDSKFKFKKSGPFYFISGHNQNCEKGQKLIILVLSDHHHNAPSLSPETPHKPSSSAPSPSPAAKPVPPVKQPSRSPSPSHHSPIPSPTPKTPLHAPPVKPPSHNSPTVAPAPHIHHPPTHSPARAPPSHSPCPSSTSPAPITHRSSPTPSPHATLPIKPPTHPPSPSRSPKNTPPSHLPSPYLDKEAPAPSPSPHPEADSPKNNKGTPPTEQQNHRHAPNAVISAGFA